MPLSPELIQAFEADLQARSAKRKRKSTGDVKPATAEGETERPQTTTSASSVSTADDDELLNQPNTDRMDVQDTSEGIGSPKVPNNTSILKGECTFSPTGAFMNVAFLHLFFFFFVFVFYFLLRPRGPGRVRRRIPPRKQPRPRWALTLATSSRTSWAYNDPRTAFSALTSLGTRHPPPFNFIACIRPSIPHPHLHVHLLHLHLAQAGEGRLLLRAHAIDRTQGATKAHRLLRVTHPVRLHQAVGAGSLVSCRARTTRVWSTTYLTYPK